MLRILAVAALCVSVWADDSYFHPSSYNRGAHVQHQTTPRPRGPPPGGYAPADAVEVATRKFHRDYARAAAAAEAAPDIDIYTTSDGLPLGSGHQQHVRYAHVQAAAAPAGPPVPVTETPEVAAARNTFLRRHSAEAARARAAQPAVVAAQPAAQAPSPRFYYREDDDDDSFYPHHLVTYQPAQAQHQPAQPLLDQHGNVIGVQETEEVRQAKQRFQAEYDSVASQLASQQAAAAPAPAVYVSRYGGYPYDYDS